METITLGNIEGATADLPLLGYTVFWSLAGIRVQHTDLKTALDAAGFDSYLPDPPTARIALRRALVEWIGERAASGQGPPLAHDGGDDETQKVTRALIRVINQKKSEWLAFALIAEDVDFLKLGLQFGTSLRIILHKKSKAMFCTTTTAGIVRAGEESAQVTRELGPHWDHYKSLLMSSDLSRMMRNLVDGLGAVSLRREGGLYFVPVARRDELERLRVMLTNLPHTTERAAYFVALGVLDRGQARRQLATAVHDRFLDELAVMCNDLRRFTEAKAGTVKSETIAERLRMYKEVKRRAETYADLLGMQQERIQGEIDNLRALAQEIVLADDENMDGSAERAKDARKADQGAIA